mmetsp:Transcript_6732/g.7655  ORF Transcript_6732/g.7655 Transcript_6732/m.7655 type:complete len:729 (-) Transcript_6732:267-2453(-)
MVVSTKVIHFSIAILIGLYAGINISGLFHRGTTFAAFGPHSDSDEDNNRMRQQLEESQAQINHLKEEAQNLKNDHSSSLRKIDQLNELCSQVETKLRRNQKIDKSNDTSSSRLFSHKSSTNLHPFCQSILPHPTPTAMALWNEHLLKVLTASRIPNDRRFMFHDFTSQLLQIISPRLQRSVKTVPYDWRPVENALTVSWERYRYLQLPQKDRHAITINEKPRPLKILIMGGSLLVGTNCRMLMKELNFQFQLPKRECTWSYRVGQFLNAFFLGESKNRLEPLFEVTKVAMGGTNTATGSAIWKYDLVPEEARNPDIVINAYSTNDMHILTVLEAESSNTTLRDRTFEMIQGFVRQVLNTKRCTKNSYDEDTKNEPIPPLLLHMDDYIGNEQRKIWETTELAQGAQVLANYYGFVSMSYADTIREFVYGDTYEKWFSSEWWVKDKKKNTFMFERQIHPGMGMHISSIWVTAYNLLHLASAYCSMPTPHRTDNIEYEAGLWGLPGLKGEFKEPMGKPQPQPKGLPPELTKDLLLEDITSLWKQSATKDQQQQSNITLTCSDQNRKDSSSSQIKCPFSWVSGLSLQQNNITWIDEYFRHQSSTWEGWELSEDGGKIGFIPSVTSRASGKNSSQLMVLDFEYSQKIRSVTFFFMKSYGTKWINSELEAKIWSSNHQLLEERNMLGTHKKNTSEMYTEEIVFNKPADSGDRLQLEVKLIGGETFKIMGLAVCS